MGIYTRKAFLAIVSVMAVAVMSFLALFRPNGIIRNVSAVESVNIGVYWDDVCTKPVTFIDWGSLYPGSQKVIKIYITNENTSAIRFLFVKTDDWVPPNASDSMRLSFNYTEHEIDQNEVINATLALDVSIEITGIERFEFNIIICGSQYVAGDVDHDGDVDPRDFFLLGKAFGSTPNDINWNPDADFNDSGKVDMDDFFLLARNFGKHYL